jgi:putative ABC transport system permease protein
MLSDLVIRFRSLFRRDKVEAELDDELRSHLEQQVEKYVRSGLRREEALRRARIEFGGLDQVKQDCREARGVNLIETILQDLRFAVRLLCKTPATSTVALLSLALGIGANTAIFSLVDAVMLRMLPVRDPGQLVQLKFRSPKSANLRQSVTNPIWEQVRDHQDVFSGVFAWGPDTFDLANGGEQDSVHGIYASGSYFVTLGVRPAAGRLLIPSDDVRGCGGAAVLGYGFWQRRYGGAASAIGSMIRLDGHPFPIVGVAQRGFTGADVGEPLDVAVPICAEAIFHGKDSFLDGRSTWWLLMMGRLKPGTTVEQAAARLNVLSPQIFSASVPLDWDSASQQLFRKYSLLADPAGSGTGGFTGIRKQYGQPLEILMVVVALVLLIACANIASLQLARSAARRREIGLRMSLGASRTRLLRQVLTESLALSLSGTVLGAVFARWGSVFLVRMVSPSHDALFLDLSLDMRVLAFTSAIAVLTGLLFGVAPALGATRTPAVAAIKETQEQAGGGRSRSAAVRWIVAAQVALSLTLLVGAGLFIRTFTNLMSVDAGFDRNNVLLVDTNIHNAQVPDSARVPLYGQMLARIQTLPGVVSAGQTWMRPLSGSEWNNNIEIQGRQLPTGVDPLTYLNWITPDYLATMRTRLISGRSFDARDSASSLPVAVVNQTFARRFFPGENPLGKRFSTGERGPVRAKWLQIVGVMQDAKYDDLREDFVPVAYFPLVQMADVSESSTFEIRTAADPNSLIPAVRDAIGSVNRVASLEFFTLQQEADDTAIQERLLAVLSGFFGALALVLTAIGLYGVMAYVVTLRTREIGIRVALGASRGSVLSLVLRDLAALVVVGSAAGAAISFWLTRYVQHLLFGLRPIDGLSFVLAAAALAVIVIAASYLPARRAMRVNPTVALRYE